MTHVMMRTSYLVMRTFWSDGDLNDDTGDSESEEQSWDEPTTDSDSDSEKILDVYNK